MNDEMEQLCKNLKLKKILQVVGRELARAEKQEPSYEAFLLRLLRYQYNYQQERSLAYRIANAKLPEKWALDTFPFKKQKGVRKAAIMQLAELDFISRADNIVFIGDTGVGKTGLATGLLLSALQNGYRGLFIKAQDLFEQMYASLADHSSRRLVNRLMNIDVLLIDELGR